MTASQPSAKVALLTCEYPPFPGGIATYVVQVNRVLRDAGIATLVLAPAYEGATEEAGVVRAFGHHKIGPAAALKALAQVRALPRDAIIMAADIRTVLLAHALRLATGRRYRAIIHGSEVSKFVGRSAMKVVVKAAYLGAELISANSEATARAFEASFGRTEKLVVNYLGVDEARFAPVDGPFEAESLSGIAADAPLVATVGRIEDRKGQAEAVEVVHRAALLLGRPLTYVVAGVVVDPAYAERIKAAAERFGVPVVFAGRISDADVARLYRRAACHLLLAQPSETKIEGFGLVLVEAAAQGCPSVATSVGGIPEVLDALQGVVKAPGDTGGVAAAVAQLCSDSAARTARSEAALAGARKFSWRACVEGIFPELFA